MTEVTRMLRIVWRLTDNHDRKRLTTLDLTRANKGAEFTNMSMMVNVAMRKGWLAAMRSVKATQGSTSGANQGVPVDGKGTASPHGL